MNIKFGMDNFYVRYLKRFLNHEMSQSKAILGKFDVSDLQLLVKYLNLPNVKNMFEVGKEIVEVFPELKTMFNMRLQDDVIEWTSKHISADESQFLMKNTNKIKAYCKTVGWELLGVDEWIDVSKDINGDGSVDNVDREILYDIIYHGAVYDLPIMAKADLNLDGVINEQDLAILDDYLANGKLSLKIGKTERTNYFPNKDMLVFINQFEGTFLYDYSIRDSEGQHDVPHYNPAVNTKIALFQCTPGQKITIAHNSGKKVHMVIGCSSAKLKQTLTNENEVLQNVQEIDLRPGQGYQYTCTSEAEGTGYDAHWVCIQVPSDYGDLSGSREKTMLLEVGDINFDGQIDLQDYTLLARYTAKGPGSEEMHWEATEKQKAVMDVNRDGKIDVDDARILYRFINHDPLYPSLGLVSYTYTGIGSSTEGDNVKNLLIIDGHYDDDVNIPFLDFVTDDWVIHEKFFNYLLGMAIHKYSDGENITYLQQLLKEQYPEHSYDANYFYPSLYSDRMKELVKMYQVSKASYTLGDLNRDNKITKEDLQILREFLDNTTSLTPEERILFDRNNDGIVNQLDYDSLNKDKEVIRYYLDGKLIIPESQLPYYDFDGDGEVTESDFELVESWLAKIQEYLEGLNKFNDIQKFRADVNQDGYIDETDYEIMEAEVQGKTSVLHNFDIPFMLGWYDVQTEGLLEQDVNLYGNLSEVSK